MNRKIVLWSLAALVVLGAGAQEHRRSHSRSKVDAKKVVVSPFDPDDGVALISADTVDKLFLAETTLRERMKKERFFAKPLADQKSAMAQNISFLAADPLHGLSPRFAIGSDKDFRAQDDFKALMRYMEDGQVRTRLVVLLQKSQGVLFNRPAKMRAQLEFYNKVGTQVSAGLRIFDEMMYKLANGAPAFKKEKGLDAHATWYDILDYCKIPKEVFFNYFAFDSNSHWLRLDPLFENQLGSVKTHGDELPPAECEAWTTAAKKFLEEDIEKFRTAVKLAAERAGGNARVLALQRLDLEVAGEMEKVLKGMIKIRDTFNDGSQSSGQLRTGKGLYKYTKSCYALPSMPTDKVPDHLYLINLMFRRFQNDMQGLRVRMTPISDEQRRKAAEWRKQHMKSWKK